MSEVYQRILKTEFGQLPKKWQRYQTIDMHTGGEPLRVILSGFPEPEGSGVLAYRRLLQEKHDHLRQLLMFEPRGHADMYGCVLCPPNTEDGDFGIVFLHNEGYSTMCGHAIIAIATLAVELGWKRTTEPITTLLIDAPCGRIKAFVQVTNGEVQKVTFHGVPSFVLALDAEVEVPGLGIVRYDLAYGGAYYAYVQAALLGLELVPANYTRLIETGMAIKRAVMNSDTSIEHPFEADLSFLYGTIFIGSPVSDGVDSRNVCIFADGEVDRCPTGSGVSGRMPIHWKRKELGLGEEMEIESLIGSRFRASILKTTQYGPYEAVIPIVEGQASITGQHEFVLDPRDPFPKGFFLR